MLFVRKQVLKSYFLAKKLDEIHIVARNREIKMSRIPILTFRIAKFDCKSSSREQDSKNRSVRTILSLISTKIRDFRMVLKTSMYYFRKFCSRELVRAVNGNEA